MALVGTEVFQTVIGNQSLLSGTTGEKTVRSGASVVLLDKEGKTIWSAP
jgi:hypothetical protein